MGKAVRLDDALHARVAAAAKVAGVTISEWVARAVESQLRGEWHEITRPHPAKQPVVRRPPADDPETCPHPLSVRLGVRCGRCGTDVR